MSGYVSKRTEDIVVGDAILFLGVEHRISEIRANTGPHAFILGYAWSTDGFSISHEEGARLEVAA